MLVVGRAPAVSEQSGRASVEVVVGTAQLEGGAAPRYGDVRERLPEVAACTIDRIARDAASPVVGRVRGSNGSAVDRSFLIADADRNGRIDEWGAAEAARSLAIVVEGVSRDVVDVVPGRGRDLVPPRVPVLYRETEDPAGDLNRRVARDGRALRAAGMGVVRPRVGWTACGLAVGPGP